MFQLKEVFIYICLKGLNQKECKCLNYFLKRGTRNVYIHHTQNLINEIKELMNNFNPSKPRHRENLKGLRIV